MPSRKPRIPSYRLHKATGQAVVTLAGRDYYLGQYDSPESHQEYKRLVGEYLASGGSEPLPSGGVPDLTVAELLDRYSAHAEAYYPGKQPGKSSSGQIDRVKRALAAVRELYGQVDARQFGPRALKAVRQSWVDAGCCRRYVNQLTDCVKRCWKWAVADELVPPGCYEALHAVEGLKVGRTEAPESEGVAPVEQWVLDLTIPLLNSTLRDVARLQLLTGMRPGEALTLRAGEIDRTADVWVYTPSDHKTRWRGKERTVLIGPQAQALLAPYLVAGGGYCFPPSRHACRGTGHPHYLVSSYARAVLRACDRADRAARLARAEAGSPAADDDVLVPRWHPHQLRHNAATAVKDQFGWEIARQVLGHSTLDATKIYATDTLGAAADAIRRIG
jgi:integrase